VFLKLVQVVNGFLQLKEALQNKVNTFIKNGTRIMTQWSNTNIKLLTLNRCTSLLTIALQLLDGLVSYNSEIIGAPNWPSAATKHITLLLFKYYTSNCSVNIDRIVDYLEVSKDTILSTGAKILSNLENDDDALKLLNSLATSDINLDDAIQNEFVSECLMHFDMILTVTTIELWKSYKNKCKQNSALNLKNQKKSLDTVQATAATAVAIAKATENINQTNSQSTCQDLRILNLEKANKRQEQKSNEILKHLKRNVSTQKNFKRSRQPESSSAPMKQTLNKNKPCPTPKIVDLMLDNNKREHQETPTPGTPPFPQNSKKQKLNHKQELPTLEKTVHWQNAEILNYHPHHPEASTFIPQNNHQGFHAQTFAEKSTNPPLFPPAPLH